LLAYLRALCDRWVVVRFRILLSKQGFFDVAVLACAWGDSFSRTSVKNSVNELASPLTSIA
jgi:hypothetical protein